MPKFYLDNLVVAKNYHCQSKIHQVDLKIGGPSSCKALIEAVVQVPTKLDEYTLGQLPCDQNSGFSDH